MDKHDVIKFIEGFDIGFHLDYDQWDVDGKNWLRFKRSGHSVVFIIYKGYEWSAIYRILGRAIYDMGKDDLRREFNELMTVNK